VAIVTFSQINERLESLEKQFVIACTKIKHHSDFLCSMRFKLHPRYYGKNSLGAIEKAHVWKKPVCGTLSRLTFFLAPPAASPEKVDHYGYSWGFREDGRGLWVV
jgi:hypothetical protein